MLGDMDNHDTEPLGTASVTPAPGSAPAPGSGSVPGAAPESASSFLRRHAIGVGVTAAVLAVVVVAGGTAWGVSAAVASTRPAAVAPASADTAMHGSASHVAASHKKTHGKRADHGAVGTLTAVNGDTWTLKAASGKTLTVTLSSTTAFGTAKTPATRDSFTTGSRVGVLGKRTGDTVAATRIVHLPLHASTGKPSPAPSA